MQRSLTQFLYTDTSIFAKREDCEQSLILAVTIVGRAKYTRARAKFRVDATRGKRWRFPRVASLRKISRALVRISLAPQSPSPTLETTRSLVNVFITAGLIFTSDEVGVGGGVVSGVVRALMT